MIMRIAINMEHIGSTMYQLKLWTRREETMTPTLPIVSARMWRNTPVWGEGGRGEGKSMRVCCVYV